MSDSERARHRRLRTRPSPFHPNYLSLRNNLKTFRGFSALINSGSRLTLLDIGCGNKPFSQLVPENVLHVGVDFDRKTAADVHAVNESLPIRDDCIDAVIASETLEHTFDVEKAVNEIIRVCKNGALVYVSAPFLYPIHNPPYDFQRLTRYRLESLFAEHHILLLNPSNSLFSSWLVILGETMAYCSYFLPYSGVLSSLPIFLSNSLARLIEGSAQGVWNLTEKLGLGPRSLRRAERRNMLGFWNAMPIGYAMVVRVKKDVAPQPLGLR
jgi:SAM-dependent methyltransferase